LRRLLHPHHKGFVVKGGGPRYPKSETTGKPLAGSPAEQWEKSRTRTRIGKKLPPRETGVKRDLEHRIIME